jgi:hypothetical protein
MLANDRTCVSHGMFKATLVGMCIFFQNICHDIHRCFMNQHSSKSVLHSNSVSLELTYHYQWKWNVHLVK